MENTIITVTPNQALGLQVDPQALVEKARLITLLADIKGIGTAEEARYAAEVMRAAKGFTSIIEAARKEVKEPVLQLGKAIDRTAQDLTTGIEIQITRLSRNLGDYTFKVAEEKRLAEQRAREEREELERVAQEKLARARTDASRDKIEEKLVEAKAETRMQVAAVADQRPEGIALRMVYKFEVTDIKALHAANPMLVKMEANTAAINAILKTLGDSDQIPGIRWWKEAAVNVR
jgi:hypothetical protein